MIMIIIIISYSFPLPQFPPVPLIQCHSTLNSFVVISPITGARCPEGSRKLRFPDYVTVAQDGGKVVSHTYRPLFTPREYSWYSFLLEAESNPEP